MQMEILVGIFLVISMISSLAWNPIRRITPVVDCVIHRQLREVNSLLREIDRLLECNGKVPSTIPGTTSQTLLATWVFIRGGSADIFYYLLASILIYRISL